MQVVKSSIITQNCHNFSGINVEISLLFVLLIFKLLCGSILSFCGHLWVVYSYSIDEISFQLNEGAYLIYQV